MLPMAGFGLLSVLAQEVLQSSWLFGLLGVV
jgi:hypothetical protein